MDADTIIQGWQARLIAMADWPAYVFRHTATDLIDRHYRRLTQFVGYAEADIAAVEDSLGIAVPAVFRAYLGLMARSPGDLFRGSDLAGIDEFPRFRQSALDLLAETDATLSLPRRAIVFMSHQGYTFLYLECAGGFDTPPMQWVEGEPSPKQVAAGFAQMVDAELGLMERNNRAFRERGGYYMTLHAGGGQSQEFPALASGDRPLDRTPNGGSHPGRRSGDA